MVESEKLNPFLGLAAMAINTLMPLQQKSRSQSRSRSRSRTRKESVTPSGWGEYNMSMKKIAFQLDQDIDQLDEIAD
jgi:hypothetical protein